MTSLVKGGRVSKWVLGVILVMAGVLRFVGVSPGYPPIHADEGVGYSQAIAMILEGSLTPKHGYGEFYNYGIVVPLVNAILYIFIFMPLASIGYLVSHAREVTGLVMSGKADSLVGLGTSAAILGRLNINVLFWGRYVTAGFGTAAAGMAYVLGRSLFKSERVGLLGAFLVAINYRQVLNSHLGLPDIYNVFFCLRLCGR